jgi:hypothetical protein
MKPNTLRAQESRKPAQSALAHVHILRESPLAISKSALFRHFARADYISTAQHFARAIGSAAVPCRVNFV